MSSSRQTWSQSRRWIGGVLTSMPAAPKWLLGLGARLIVSTSGMALSAGAAEVHLSDFFAEGPQAVAISPSGEWLAFSAREETRTQVYTRSIATGVGRKTDLGGSVDQLVFINDRQLAFRAVENGRQKLGLLDFQLGQSIIFTPDGAAVSLYEAQPPPWQSGRLFFRMEYAPEGLPGLRFLKVPSNALLTGFEHERAPGTHAAIADWILDPEGRVVALTFADGPDRSLAISSGADSAGKPSWREVFTSNEDDFPQFSSLNAGSGQLVAAGYFQGNFSSAVVFDPATRQFGPQLLGEKDSNIRSVLLSPDRRRHDAYNTWSHPAEYVPLTEDFRRAASVINQVVGDRAWEIAGVARDYSAVLVVQTSDTQPPKYWHIDLRTKRGFVFFDLSQRLAKHPLPPMKPVTIAARDGLPLPGFEILPKGLPANAPLLVFVGGGPFTGVTREWSPLLQALAFQQMAVVTVNYRGARGFGRAFYRAGYGQAAGSMVDDVEDVLRHLRESKEYRRRTMVVVGTSFGGFLAARALARGSVHADGLVLLSSLIDPADFLDRAATRRASEKEIAYQRQKFFGGEVPAECSLLTIVGKLPIPQRVIHGLRDDKVPVAAAREYARRAAQAHEGVEWVEVDDEHELEGFGSRIRVAELISEFVQKLRSR